MLEAEPAELLPESDGELGAHLRVCEACAAAARRIHFASGRLAADLTPAPRIPPAVVRPVRRLRRWGTAALAAAAAVTLLLLDVSRTPPLSVPPAETAATAVPAVSVPPGRNAMVFRTADPKITVVWYY